MALLRFYLFLYRVDYPEVPCGSKWLSLGDFNQIYLARDENKRNITQCEDSLIWQYESKGIYSAKSLYDVVNFRGVQPVYSPAVWSIKVPPGFRGFYGKILICDNLRKCGIAKPLECVRCTQIESGYHFL